MELTTTSIISLFDTNKEERERFVSLVIDQLQEGNADAMKTHYALKCMEDIIANILANNNYREIVLSEAQKYGGKKFEYRNSEISIKETGVKYDFSMCNDPEYLDMKDRITQLTAQMKEKEAFLKRLPEGGINVVIDDEVVHVFPPSKSSTTTIAVSLK